MLKINEARVADAAPRHRMHVLLLAADGKLGERVATRLVDAGYEVSETHDLSTALQILSRAPVHLIVFEVGAERAQAMDALRSLAHHGLGAPLLGLLADGTLDDVIEATKRGAFSMLLGGWSDEALLSKVASAAEHARAQDPSARAEHALTTAAQVGIPERPFAWGERLPSLREAREAFDRIYLEELMARVDGNVAAAARVSGRNRTDLYDLLRRCHVNAADFRPRAIASAKSATTTTADA
jgi:DNA-binding NtrC family response regulator